MRAAGAPTAAPGRHASTYQGATWEGLGIILDAPPGSESLRFEQSLRAWWRWRSERMIEFER